jgi:hypothetical protein
VVTAVFGTGACTTVESKDSDAALCAQPLTNVVQAPSWVQAISAIRTYRYQSHLDSVDVSVDLLGDDGELLGAMTVRQVYGDAAFPNGSMHGVLRRDGLEPISVTTVGERIDAERYRVRARLEDEGATLDVAATFVNRFCYRPAGSQSPPCAGDLALADAAYTLPSCGVLLDEVLWAGRAPTLERLEYGAAPSGLRLPALATARFDGGYRILPVMDQQGLQAPDVIAQWAREQGLDSLLGSEGERLLTTAFLDRTWRRELERHASHCAASAGPSPTPQALRGQSCSGLGLQSEPVGSMSQPLCEGSATQPSASDWADNHGAEDTGGFWGDPHLTSHDGTAFDFQAAGEFLLLESTAEVPLVLQARFEPMETTNDIPACRNISVGTAVAALAGDQRVTAYARPSFRAQLDGTELASGQAVALEDGGVLRVTRGSVTMEWPGGQRIEFEGGGNTSRLSIALPPSLQGRVRGVLGQFDGDRSNDFVTRGGELLPAPPGLDEMYAMFGDSWRITPNESLFDYGPGESTESFTLENFPLQSTSLGDLPSDDVNAAVATCAALELTDPVVLDGCVLDVVCAGPSAAALAVGAPAVRASLPPSLPGVMVEGNTRFRSPPAQLLLTPWTSPDAGQGCVPPQAQPMLLHKEQESVELNSPLPVDTVPGADAPSPIAAGTRVTSYLLHRRPGGPSSPDLGTIYLSRPVVGVIYRQTSLDASDAVVGHPSTTYTSGARGLDDDDEVRTNLGARTVTVSLAGDDADQIRILTEAP